MSSGPILGNLSKRKCLILCKFYNPWMNCPHAPFAARAAPSGGGRQRHALRSLPEAQCHGRRRADGSLGPGHRSHDRAAGLRGRFAFAIDQVEPTCNPSRVAFAPPRGHHPVDLQPHGILLRR